MLAGGQRIPVSVSEAASEVEAVVSVPADSGPLALAFDSAAEVPAPPRQTLDLVGMSRLPAPPDVLYRPGGAQAGRVELDGADTLVYRRTIARQLPGARPASRPGRAGPAAVVAGGRPGRLRTPTCPDRALLSVAVAEGSGFDKVQIPASRWRLAYPGGPSGGTPAMARQQTAGATGTRADVGGPGRVRGRHRLADPSGFMDDRSTAFDFDASALRLPVSFSPAG